MKLPKLESEDSIIDIDPFTVFGLFNKGITNANRIAILESFATVFNIKSKVPDNFDGIPVLNNLKATYYGFKDDRQTDDIDNLWGLYESAINLAEKDDATNRAIFTKWYDTVHDQLGIRYFIDKKKESPMNQQEIFTYIQKQYPTHPKEQLSWRFRQSRT